MLSTIKSRILITILLFGTLSVGLMYFYISYTFNDFSNKTANKSLDMLSQSIFQTVTQSMLAGDPQVVQNTVQEAKKIHGIESLDISKSKLTLELYSRDNESFTTDTMVKEVLESKQIKTVEKTDNSHHTIQLLKPMIAEQRCIACHANAAEGDALGVMSLVVSLDANDK
ncbi:MAG: methyl-accepting chemotaxis protein, partial [Sulfurimonas sp.]